MSEMVELFERADREGLWFYCAYQQLWFSPDELRSEQANGRFRWGAQNWQLRKPEERLAQLMEREHRIAKEANDLMRRMLG